MFESSILSHSITMPFENSMIMLAGGQKIELKRDPRATPDSAELSSKGKRHS